MDRGWGVETSNMKNVNESDDPMLQQMQIMRNYIQQARSGFYDWSIGYNTFHLFVISSNLRSANRYDDVAILEANLRDLQFEHARMQSGPS